MSVPTHNRTEQEEATYVRTPMHAHACPVCNHQLRTKNLARQHRSWTHGLIESNRRHHGMLDPYATRQSQSHHGIRSSKLIHIGDRDREATLASLAEHVHVLQVWSFQLITDSTAPAASARRRFPGEENASDHRSIFSR
jgi:hypothetical protein